MGDQWKALQETVVAETSRPESPRRAERQAACASASDLSETLRSLEKEIGDSMTSAAAKRRAEIPSVLLKALEDATKSDAPAAIVARIWDLVVASRPVALDLMHSIKMAVREGVKCFEEVSRPAFYRDFGRLTRVGYEVFTSWSCFQLLDLSSSYTCNMVKGLPGFLTKNSDSKIVIQPGQQPNSSVSESNCH